MRTPMKHLLNREALLSLPVVALVLSGCPEEPPPEGAKASVRIDAEDTTLDIGQTTSITIVSRKDGGGGNTAEVTVTAEPSEGEANLAGSLGLTADDLGDEVLAVTPNDQGEATLFFGCTGEGNVTLTATVGDLSEQVEVRCRASDNFVFSIAQLAPSSSCRTLQADGVSSCDYTLLVERVNVEDGTTDNPPGVVVTARALSVDNVVVAPGVSFDPLGTTDVLSAGPGGLTDAVTATTDAEGRAIITVRSPAFGVSEDVTIEFSAGGDTRNQIQPILPFENRSAVTLTATKTNLESGQSTTIVVAALRTDGAPAGNAEVVVENTTAVQLAITDVPGEVTTEDGRSTVLLDANGTRTITVTAPTVTERLVSTLKATYETAVDPSVPPTVTQLDINVAPPGSVNVNAKFRDDVDSLKSDTAIPEVVTIDVVAERSENPFNDVSVTASIAPDSQALIRFSGDVGGTSSVSRTVSTLTDGAVAFDIVAASVLARGTARIVIDSEVNATGERIRNELVLTVDRDPILQSVVFVSAEPPVIGVRGGTLPSTTQVRFQLLDDSGNPLDGVPVTFVTNATADRGVSVEQFDISEGGEVETTLSAGTIAGPVTVVATAVPASGLPITVESASIAVVGGLPTFLNSDFTCSKRSGATIAADCTALLVDRFSNRVGADIQVQFRAEGGNITPAAGTGAEGAAVAQFRTGNPGEPQAEVRAWSYGRPVPTTDADGDGIPNVFEGTGLDGCFDTTTRTPCDLIALCDATATDEFCPLPGLQSDPDTPVVSGAGAVDQSRRCDTELGEDSRACGFPIGCLDGTGIDCNMHAGCFDFSAATFCPENGLLTIIASARGEESFLDGNGNGILDFIDTNENGRHESNEPIGVPCTQGQPNCVDGVRQVDDFIDSPEPFLDKNGSCSRDSYLYATANGMTDIQRQVATDLFSDVDGSLTFGFDPEEDGIVTQTNGTWDRDAEIFLQTHVLKVSTPRLLFGEECTPGEPHDCTEETSPDLDDQVCIELANGEGIAPACRPDKVIQSNTNFGSYRYAWLDANGNCPTTNFGAFTSVTSNGSVIATGQNRNLDEGNCGFFPSLDADRPWCQVRPQLGAPSFAVNIAIDCIDFLDDLENNKITFTLDDEVLSSTEEIAIRIDPSTCVVP